MSTITRTVSNLRKVGIKSYFNQLLYIGDTKHGKHIGTDKAGNKYFENLDELPLRSRWVEYAKHDYDAAHINPGWHAWISYMVDKPPTEDPIMASTQSWAVQPPNPNFTATRGNYAPYNTVKPKIRAWEPKAVARQ